MITLDDNGRLYQTNYPDGGITTITYDELGRRKTVSRLLSGSDYLDTNYEYDLDNRVTTLTLPGGYQTVYVYDDFGNVLTMTDAAGDVTTNTYDYNNRPDTVTQPSGLVMTYSYDWQTQQTASILYQRNSTGGDDFTVYYGYDNDGRVLTVIDGNGHTWTKSYDAMGRLHDLTNPASVAQTLTYDGNSNITKTVDFIGTSHWYQYDALNRMSGHGHTSAANDETYTWNCCQQLSGYTDAFGTAVLVYDDLGRLLSHTDSTGNQVQYEYDALGRVALLEPPQGTNYRTEYAYNANGSLDTVSVYDSGTPADTTYTYDTTTGQLLQRDFPTVSTHWIRTAYSYDSAGRLEYETVTKENGGTTNLYKTQYAYSWPAAAYVRQVQRTEQTYSGGWVNDNRVTYKTDSLGRLQEEQREDWIAGGGGHWVSQYDITQAYDKNGNRTGYTKLVTGSTADYGTSATLSYTFNSVNQLTAIADAADSRYACAVTCDANNNITQLDESMTGAGTTPPFQTNHLYSIFEYDALNRQTKHKTKAWVAGGTNNWVWVDRKHEYNALGALVKSGWQTFTDPGPGPGYSSSLHVYDQQTGNHIQGTNTGLGTYGTRWVWAGAQNGGYGQLFGPNADTASQNAYNINAAGGAGDPQRRTFINPTTEGDKRELWGQGRPMGKTSNTAWSTGTVSVAQNTHMNPVTSRLAFEGTVSSSDYSRITDAREKGRIGIFGTGLSYAGGSGRVTSEILGRDLNPLGRGDGMAYVAGMINLGRIMPGFPMPFLIPGEGNSVNNATSSDGCYGCCNSTPKVSSGLCAHKHTSHFPKCSFAYAGTALLCYEGCDLANGNPIQTQPSEMCEYFRSRCNESCVNFTDIAGCHACCEEEANYCLDLRQQGWCKSAFHDGDIDWQLCTCAQPSFWATSPSPGVRPCATCIGAQPAVTLSSSPGTLFSAGSSRISQCCGCCSCVCRGQCLSMQRYLSQMKDDYYWFNQGQVFGGIFLLPLVAALTGSTGGLALAILGVSAVYVNLFIWWVGINVIALNVRLQMASDEQKCWDCISRCAGRNGVFLGDEGRWEIGIGVIQGLLPLLEYINISPLANFILEVGLSLGNLYSPTNPFNDLDSPGLIKC